MRASEFINEKKDQQVDEILLGAAAGLIGRAAVGAGGALAQGARTLGNAAIKGISNVGRAAGNVAKDVAGGLAQAVAGSASPDQTPDSSETPQGQQSVSNNLNQLRSMGVNVNPEQAKQALNKSSTGVPLTPREKEMMAQFGPAMRDILANPQLAGQFKDLIKKAQT